MLHPQRNQTSTVRLFVDQHVRDGLDLYIYLIANIERFQAFDMAIIVSFCGLDYFYTKKKYDIQKIFIGRVLQT